MLLFGTTVKETTAWAPSGRASATRCAYGLGGARASSERAPCWPCAGSAGGDACAASCAVALSIRPMISTSGSAWTGAGAGGDGADAFTTVAAAALLATCSLAQPARRQEPPEFGAPLRVRYLGVDHGGDSGLLGNMEARAGLPSTVACRPEGVAPGGVAPLGWSTSAYCPCLSLCLWGSG